jgi:hypothetical protein
MFYSIRRESCRLFMYSYIIFFLGFMGLPVLCYCEDGHFEKVSSIIGCLDDRGVYPNLSDDPHYSNDIHRIVSCGSCSDVVVSVQVYWNQPISSGSLVQMEKAGIPFFCSFMLTISGSNFDKITSINTHRFDRLNSPLRSVHLLI